MHAFWEFILLGEGGADPGPSGLLQGPLLLFLILTVLFYFMVLSPERKRRQEHTQLLARLKKNDEVVTAGGIIGTVVNAPEGAEEITLRIDESTNTRLRVLRSAVARVLQSSKES